MAKRTQPKLTRAKKIIRAAVSRGAPRATAVQRAVLRAGVSLRTYRTARKQMPVKAQRYSAKRRKRGTGHWQVRSRR